MFCETSLGAFEINFVCDLKWIVGVLKTMLHEAKLFSQQQKHIYESLVE